MKLEDQFSKLGNILGVLQTIGKADERKRVDGLIVTLTTGDCGEHVLTSYKGDLYVLKIDDGYNLKGVNGNFTQVIRNNEMSWQLVNRDSRFKNKPYLLIHDYLLSTEKRPIEARIYCAEPDKSVTPSPGASIVSA